MKSLIMFSSIFRHLRPVILNPVLVGLCAVIVGAGIFLNVQVYGTLLYVEQEQIKLMFLEEFSLNYNRMMASLRD